MNEPLRVLILHNLPRSAASATGTRWEASDAGVLHEVRAVESACAELGHPVRTAGVRRLTEVPEALAGGSETVVFNLVEELEGGPVDAAQVPAVCRAAGRACTGEDTPALLLCTDKWQAKAVLRAAGVPTPAAAVVAPGAAPDCAALPAGRVIAKPARSDASEGIDAAAVLDRDAPALVAAVRRAADCTGGQPVIVEQYVEGRELNVSVLQRGGRAEVLPLAEIDFSAFPDGKVRIVDYAAKWDEASFEYHHTPRVIPAPLEAAAADAVRRCARQAWEATGCRDYARVDFRLDAAGRPYVLEVNPNPDISPDAGFAAALAAAGIAFRDFVADRIRLAAARLPPAPAPAATPAPVDAGESDLVIRRTAAGDGEAILRLLSGTAVFRPGEIAIAREVLDEAIRDGAAGHYQSFTALTAGRVLGWVCWGPTPCTVAAFDVYWIAVDRSLQRRGVGAALMAHAEALIAARGGRLVVVETSGRPDYAPTRRFYLKAAYRLAASIADFYAPGDPKEIYVKGIADSK